MVRVRVGQEQQADLLGPPPGLGHVSEDPFHGGGNPAVHQPDGVMAVDQVAVREPGQRHAGPDRDLERYPEGMDVAGDLHGDPLRS